MHQECLESAQPNKASRAGQNNTLSFVKTGDGLGQNTTLFFVKTGDEARPRTLDLELGTETVKDTNIDRGECT